MKESQLHDALNELDEELIMPVAALRAKKRYPWMKWVAMAACFCLILSVPFLWQTSSDNAAGSVVQNMSQDKVYGYMADSSSNEALSGSVSVAFFTAQVLEVHETYLVVSPLEGEREYGSTDRIEVSLAGISQLPQFTVGDTVRVFYSGELEEVHPVRADGVWKIEIVE